MTEQLSSDEGRIPVTGGEHVAAKALREERTRQRDGVVRPLSDADVFQLLDRVNTLITGQEAEAEERERLMRNFERISEKQAEYEARMKRIEENMRSISERGRAEGQAEAAQSVEEAFARARARTARQTTQTRERIKDAPTVEMYVPHDTIIGINGAKYAIKGGGIRKVPRPIAEEIAHSQRAADMLEEQKRVLDADSIDEARRVDAKLQEVAQKYGARPVDESDMQAIEVIQ